MGIFSNKVWYPCSRQMSQAWMSDAKMIHHLWWMWFYSIWHFRGVNVWRNLLLIPTYQWKEEDKYVESTIWKGSVLTQSIFSKRFHSAFTASSFPVPALVHKTPSLTDSLPLWMLLTLPSASCWEKGWRECWNDESNFLRVLFDRCHWDFLPGCDSIAHSQQGFYFRKISWQIADPL